MAGAHRRVLEVGRHLADGRRRRLARALPPSGGRGRHHRLRRRSRARQHRGASNGAGDTPSDGEQSSAPRPRAPPPARAPAPAPRPRASRASAASSASHFRAAGPAASAHEQRKAGVRLPARTRARRRPHGPPARLNSGRHRLELRVERNVGVLGRGAARLSGGFCRCRPHDAQAARRLRNAGRSAAGGRGAARRRRERRLQRGTRAHGGRKQAGRSSAVGGSARHNASGTAHTRHPTSQPVAAPQHTPWPTS